MGLRKKVVHAASAARLEDKKKPKKAQEAEGPSQHRGTYLSTYRLEPKIPWAQFTHRRNSRAQAPPNRKRLHAPPLSASPAAS